MTHQPDTGGHELAPGDWKFTDGHIWFGCPCEGKCGEGATIAIPVSADGASKGRAWGWNGDKEKPTLKPSILRRDGCGWHGFLTDGEFVSV